MKPRGSIAHILPEAAVGAIGGMVATFAMQLAADRLFRQLPAPERYPLPPRELTDRVLGRRLNEGTAVAATIASHFAFGAAAGVLHRLLFRRSNVSPAISGVGYALVAWTASYFGWVPALGLLRSAATHPTRRNALMIAVHVLWGAVAGTASEQLARALAPLSGGPRRDR